MSGGSINGVVGRIVWGWNPAASINGYVVRRSREGWSLQATIIDVNVFNITQRPLVFVAPHQGGEWRWVIQTIRFPSGDRPPARAPFSISASLAPPDSTTTKGPLYVLPVCAA